MVDTNGVPSVRWVFAQWVLAIWNPGLMDFIRDPARRRGRRLYYRTKGIVLHDRELNGEAPRPTNQRKKCSTK